MDPGELAAAITGLHAWAIENAPRPEPELPRRLREHLGTEPSELEVVSQELSSYDQVNVQVALDAMAGDGDIAIDVIGLSMERGFRAGLAELAQQANRYGIELAPGPVEYSSVDVGDRTISCIQAGLLLIRQGADRVAVLLAPPMEEDGLLVEAMSTRRKHAEQWLARMHAEMRARNVYRGKVVAFGGDHPFRPRPLTVRRLPDIPRERIVLPAGTIERIERHTAGMARHQESLRAQGRHIKRGLLLHGPPGTGKTLTIMHLASLMPERTVVLLTGHALHAIGAACQLARSLEPAMVVMEDVDLVALDRRHYAANPFLFELLNAMDGLDEDADLIFVLTTNRPELLEPALASRPGRIDLAVELPLPDAPARRRLLELYAEGVEFDVRDWTPVVDATDGTSPAFIREIVRQASLRAAEREAGGPVVLADLTAVIDQLRHRSGRLTATLLGAERPAAPEIDEGQESAVEGWDAYEEDW